MGSLVGFRLCRLHVVFSACRVSVCFGAWSRAPQLDCCHSAYSLLVLTEYCALTNISGERTRCAFGLARLLAVLLRIVGDLRFYGIGIVCLLAAQDLVLDVQWCAHLLRVTG